jgi:TatD DNase family protein
MKIHDTHAHLDYLLKEKPELRSSITKTLENYDFWIQPGVNLVRDRYCLENFLLNPNEFPNMYFMIGAHPGEVNLDGGWNLESFMNQQAKLISDFTLDTLNPRIIAIGEIGLDYRPDMQKALKTEQARLFKAQLTLSLSLNLPFVIHCRDAFADLLQIMDQTPHYPKFLVHCFTGNKQEYEEVTKRGGVVAFGGICTYPSASHLLDIAKDAKNYVVETDLPWLAPTPFRGQTNLPEYIECTIEKLALVKGISRDEVLRESKENTCKLFSKII